MGSASRWRVGWREARCRVASGWWTTASADFDLAYALMDAPDVTILVDACPRGESPGTLYVIEPDLTAGSVGEAADPGVVDAHAMNPMLVHPDGAVDGRRSEAHSAGRV